jgi:hypothetical protein
MKKQTRIQIKRRDFLKTTLLTGAATTMSAGFITCKTTDNLVTAPESTGTAAASQVKDIPVDSEVMRSKPDIIVYKPAHRNRTNQQLIVMPTQSGAFIATWTTATSENLPDQTVVVSRSSDRGLNWTSPVSIDAPNGVVIDKVTMEIKQEGDTKQSQYSVFFEVPHSGRIYLFYHKHTGIQDIRRDITGELRFVYSDDDAVTWSDPHLVPMRRVSADNSDPRVPANCICCTPMMITNNGDVMMSIERWTSPSRAPVPTTHLLQADSSVWFLRFDNILTENDPTKLKVTMLPEGNDGIRVPFPKDSRVSVAQAPSVQSLSDGRLFCTMRTATGYLYYAISNNGGESWDTPQPLRYVEGGPPMLHPTATCPLFKLRDGRFLQIFHNNDGTFNHAKPDVVPSGPQDSRRVRTPVWIAVGREVRFGKGQPLMFSKPKVLAANDFVPYGGGHMGDAMGNTEIGTSPSLFEYEGLVYFFYPDRKHFLLGKILASSLISDSGLPL